MRKIQYALAATIIVPTVLWLAADTAIWGEYEFVAWRTALLNYTGIVSIGAMSCAMVLALRSSRLEDLLGGLDKEYRLHKWLGIASLIFAVAHFLLANVPKIVMDAGTLTASEEAPVPPLANPVLALFHEYRALAEEFGDWGFKAFAVLIAVALIKWFPYRFFFHTHRLLSLVFICLAFHSLALMNFDYWGHVIGPLVAFPAAIGGLSAIVSLPGLIGLRRRALGEVVDIQHVESNQVLKIAVKLKQRWQGHEAGQFAFVTFDRREGAHPLTIATPWTGDGKVGFFVKELGDYTETLPSTLKIGDLVTVEGPYGRFKFDSDRPRQIWGAGGIGIAPFASRIKALIDQPNEKPVDFFYSTTPGDNDLFLERIRSASEQAGVRLHLVRPETDGFLDGDKICATVPEWYEAEFLFCGPSKFVENLQKDLTARGLKPDAFHRELFDMR